jgi:hypothetical protein
MPALQLLPKPKPLDPDAEPEVMQEIRELTEYIRSVHAECRHRFDDPRFPPERRLVQIDFSRAQDVVPEGKPVYVTYIFYHCAKCRLTVRFPIVDFCKLCGTRMKKAGAHPPGWRREQQHPFRGSPPEAYVCGNESCQAIQIVADALYEPPPMN